MIAVTIVLALLFLAAAFGAWWLRAELHRTRERHAGELADKRAQWEAELTVQAARTAALFDRMVEGIIVVGATGRIRLANRAAAELFGFAPSWRPRGIMKSRRW